MRIYRCGNCDYPVYFENVVCSNCSSWLGYEPSLDRMVALLPGGNAWKPFNNTDQSYQYCSNHQHQACNWLVVADQPTSLCEACDLNGTIPDISNPKRLKEWQELELAKHRLVYALNRLGLPVVNKMTSPARGLEFDFLADQRGEDKVMTGHDEGLITMNVNEADPVARESARVQMHENYRTLIGHFRHEVGHYYWDRLVANKPDLLERFRNIFGDERADYGKALQLHYKQGPPANWQSDYISEYATTHPWEDWAETWAHYLHLLDMLETAHSFGITVDPPGLPAETMYAKADFDPYLDRDIVRIIATCTPLTFAVNSLNRGMGRKDIYPFVLNKSVRRKLHFINEVIDSVSAYGS